PRDRPASPGDPRLEATHPPSLRIILSRRIGQNHRTIPAVREGRAARAPCGQRVTGVPGGWIGPPGRGVADPDGRSRPRRLASGIRPGIGYDGTVAEAIVGLANDAARWG